jgi:hypothetical protein
LPNRQNPKAARRKRRDEVAGRRLGPLRPGRCATRGRAAGSGTAGRLGVMGVTWAFLQDCTLSEAEAGWVEAAGAQRPEPFARPLDLRPEVVARERDVLPLHRRDVHEQLVAELDTLAADIVRSSRRRSRSCARACRRPGPQIRLGLGDQRSTASSPCSPARRCPLSVQSCRDSHATPLSGIDRRCVWPASSFAWTPRPRGHAQLRQHAATMARPSSWTRPRGPERYRTCRRVALTVLRAAPADPFC